MKTVAVIDYGMSNLRSVAKALEHVGSGDWRVRVTGRAEEIAAADRVVFPGQGAIGRCMAHLAERGLIEVLAEVLRRRPFLGICLGLQSLMQQSEEDGGTPGLGLIAGHVVRFPHPLLDPRSGMPLKVPHMGWNEVHPTVAHPLWSGLGAGERFYFVHSYYVVPQDPGVVAATTRYGVEFASALIRDNLAATQFHPEKSQKAGLRLLANFLAWKAG